jgi:hypothetical protein
MCIPPLNFVIPADNVLCSVDWVLFDKWNEQALNREGKQYKEEKELRVS